MTTPITPSPALDWDKAKGHLAIFKAEMDKYNGKPDHNPHLHKMELGIPYIERELKREKLTPELHAKIMALDTKLVPLVKTTKLHKEWTIEQPD